MKKSILLALGLSLCLSFSAYAGEWKQDGKGWWYKKEDGSRCNNGWEQIDGKYYYFGTDGYMLSDTVTPDGYTVGSDGAWIEKNQAEDNPDIELLLYRTSNGDLAFKQQIRQYYNDLVHQCSDFISIKGKRYFQIIRMFDGKGNPIPRERIGDFEKKRFKIFLLAMDEASGRIEQLYEFPAVEGEDAELTENIFSARGKLCCSLTYWPISYEAGKIEKYFQYDLVTGEMKETTYEENSSLKVDGKYCENDHLYYTVWSDLHQSKVKARNYKNEQVMDLTVHADYSEYIPNGYYYKIGGGRAICSDDTSVTFTVILTLSKTQTIFMGMGTSERVITVKADKTSGRVLQKY